MGIVDKNHMFFHLYFHHHHNQTHHHHQGKNKEELKDIPKGCLAIMVGQGEEQQRIVIPVIYMNHPLFMQLLKEAEDEYGFEHQGPINIPCQMDEFRYVQDKINKDNSHHHHHHHHYSWCFKA